MSIAIQSRTGQGLVSTDLFDRLTNRIAKKHDMQVDFAARIVDQALAFLRTCGETHQASLAPSELVDIGWHTFILYTKPYAEFCAEVVGRFVHHMPNDDGEGETDSAATITRTKDAIRSAGFLVDDELWLALKVQCTDGEDGCRASGKDGNENTDSNGTGR